MSSAQIEDYDVDEVEYDNDQDATKAYSSFHRRSRSSGGGTSNPLMEIENLNEVPSSNLVRWNRIAAVFQFIQCGVLFYLSYDANTKWFLYTNYPITLDERQEEGENNVEGAADGFGVPGPEEIAAYSVTWYSAVFIAMSGLDHLIVTLPCFKSKYEYYLARNQNPFRWTEYTFSASLMRMMIAQLSGVTDIHLLGMIYVLAGMTMILGACHESVNAKARADGYKQNWFPFLAAWLPHLASWAVIFCYFFTAVSEGDPPGFVWSIVFILFILDGSFAALFYFQWAQICGFSSYIRGEKGFIVLSFTAKALLAWINYGGGSR
jgi:uncharacterized membrane protein YecN with MAPEG domain